MSIAAYTYNRVEFTFSFINILSVPEYVIQLWSLKTKSPSR